MIHRLLVLVPLMLAGCSTVPTPLSSISVTDIDRQCLALFDNTDHAISQAGVGDAGAARIKGFPWLRTDRFLASFREEVDDSVQFRDWLTHLEDLDRDARHYELQNLKSSSRQALHNQWIPIAEQHRLPSQLDDALDHCRTLLSTTITGNDLSRDALRAAAVASDAYNSWQRVLGLYPIARRVARPRVEALHRQLEDIYQDTSTERGAFRYYAVNDDPAPEHKHASQLIRDLPRDSLGVPAMPLATRDLLLATHAPVWGVETRSTADLPGTLLLNHDANPRVDTEQATEYRWLSWTRFQNEVLIQLNYMLLFSERPRLSAFDLVAGELDGVIWRTTLDSDGQILAHDSIHPCGCYYALLPASGWTALPQPTDQEPIFVPDQAPVPENNNRLVLLFAAGTRYFIDVAARPLPPGTHTLLSATADKLRSLPLPGGKYASVYRPDGLIPASRRPERFVFWPFGVPSAGTLRQPGTHAIAFIGRRHFDDAWLLHNLLIRSESQ
ncbi:hypothetical protein [Nitrincola sp. MINF-07-Sa-05]|uniref:hypothetical protein n=1 Tax=Nitrincola salilacus TaxID=3400273 RepID=UPI0039185B7A